MIETVISAYGCMDRTKTQLQKQRTRRHVKILKNIENK